ncbi:MAG: hypothetical protein GX446_04010 [Chthonomonadales bacterium]|nr:hypothetical protein [Chthonomonadales bacterium]
MGAFDDYRKAQRALRNEFAGLTARLCATCPNPCCRVPARVGPVDVLLAQAGGWREDGDDRDDPVMIAIAQATSALVLDGEPLSVPCPFLRSHGCTFPDDLRPVECTAFVCRDMLAAMDARQRARVRRLVGELRRSYARLSRGFARKVPAAPDR